MTSVSPRRLRVRARGVVQGVGFRPFVHRLARRLDLVGFVRNDAAGVLAEVEGERVDDFVEALKRETPPRATIDALEVQSVPARGEASFEVQNSVAGRSLTRIPSDAGICEACLEDLFDPQSRFHLYPFTACTCCGPRYSAILRLPYDRARTKMAPFPLCEACARDYRDIENRRFHDEQISCPRCGPRLSHAPAEIFEALRAGQIVAVKGVGGFHLVCDAQSEASVARLRRHKRRDAKPLAIMIANCASLGGVAYANAQEQALLKSPARPIVLVARGPALGPMIAPRVPQVGVMLPYAALHWLIFHAAAGAPKDPRWREAKQSLALVVTSANVGGEPLIADNSEARVRLANVADLIVVHDRDIAARVDDSVVGVIDGAPSFLRRSRGFVPDPIALSAEGPPILAVGAQEKSTVTVTRGAEAFVSQHIGDLGSVETARFFRETASRLVDLLDVKPQAVASDLHPNYASTRFAETQGLPILKLQHHAAHLSAVLAEHRVRGPALGLALDGHGLGPRGEAWGGELMRVCDGEWRWLGGLSPLWAPGGDRAAREPWRMAVAALARLGRHKDVAARFAGVPGASSLAQSFKRGFAPPQTSSMGRLFDAAAALLGLSTRQSFEAEAAMALEALVETPRNLAGAYRIDGDRLDFLPLLDLLARADLSPREGAELFHGVLIDGLAAWIERAAVQEGLTTVAFGGGCFSNRVLAEGLAARLKAQGLRPLQARLLPPNDGGLSFGQAAMAAAIMRREPALKEGEPCA